MDGSASNIVSLFREEALQTLAVRHIMVLQLHLKLKHRTLLIIFGRLGYGWDSYDVGPYFRGVAVHNVFQRAGEYCRSY